MQKLAKLFLVFLVFLLSGIFSWLTALSETVYDEKVISFAQLTLPRAFDFDGQYYYICDEFDQAVYQIDTYGQTIQKIVGDYFLSPTAVVYQFPFLYITDNHNGELIKIEKEPTAFFQKKQSVFQNLKNPTDLTVDLYGNFYLLEKDNNQIVKINSNFQKISQFGRFGDSRTTLQDPVAIALDSQQNIYIADNGQKQIKKFTMRGEFIDSYTCDFEKLTALSVDTSENIYVCDRDCIKVFNQANLIASLSEFKGQPVAPLDIKILGENIFVLDETKKIFVIKKETLLDSQDI